MFSEINGQRLMPYGALEHESISQTERLLIQENLLLRQSCQQLMHQMDQLAREKDLVDTQYHTFHLLYFQLKHDRNRIARQLTSAQRELEHLRRAQVLTNHIALGHHPLEAYRRRQPSYYRSLKTSGHGSAAANIRHSSRRFRRTQSAKYTSSDQFSSKSTYKRFDTLNEYMPSPTPVIEQQPWQPMINQVPVNEVNVDEESNYNNNPLLPNESCQHPHEVHPS